MLDLLLVGTFGVERILWQEEDPTILNRMDANSEAMPKIMLETRGC